MVAAKFLYRYLGILAFAMGLALVLHLGVKYLLGEILLEDKIILAYTINVLATALICVLLFTFRKKMKHQIGFLFMGGSMLKFLLFFLFFYPTYQADGEMSRSEFLTFFIPYVVALVVETRFAAQLAQRMDP